MEAITNTDTLSRLGNSKQIYGLDFKSYIENLGFDDFINLNNFDTFEPKKSDIIDPNNSSNKKKNNFPTVFYTKKFLLVVFIIIIVICMYSYIRL